MRYSLLSRYQGGLVGSLVGEILASKAKLGSVSLWSQIAISTGENLTAFRSYSQAGVMASEKPWLLARQTANSSEAALATLPIVLFFHESPSLLQEQLQQAASQWLHPTEAIEDVLAWGQAISLALRGKLAPAQLVSQLLTNLEASSTPLVAHLVQVQRLLAEGAGLQQTATSLARLDKASCRAIALALYCFSDTPDDFRLCVCRALQAGFQPQTTAALVGALAGVYNSISGIPVAWRLASAPQAMDDRIAQAERLFAAWSGAYSLSPEIARVAVSSSGTIQPRASLKIISQEN